MTPKLLRELARVFDLEAHELVVTTGRLSKNARRLEFTADELRKRAQRAEKGLRQHERQHDPRAPR